MNTKCRNLICSNPNGVSSQPPKVIYLLEMYYLFSRDTYQGGDSFETENVFDFIYYKRNKWKRRHYSDRGGKKSCQRNS